MSLLVAILTLVLLAVVFLLVSAPLRRATWLRGTRHDLSARGGAGGGAGSDPELGAGDPEPGDGDAERDELEAAREAKYREIRDAELDYRTGKLSREDYEAIDRALRAEAIEILDRLDGTGA